MKVIFLPAAEAEFLEQVAWYESQQAGLGALYVAAVEAALQLLAAEPQLCALAREPALRRFVLRQFPFSLYFRENNGVVQVVAVAHHRRRPEYWNHRI